MKLNDKVEVIKFIEQKDLNNIYIIRENKRYYKYIIFATFLDEFDSIFNNYTFTPFYKCDRFNKQLLKQFLSENYNKSRVEYYPKNTVKIDYEYFNLGKIKKDWYGAVRIKLSKAQLCKLLMEN